MKLVLSVRALNALTATFYALAIGSGIALNMIVTYIPHSNDSDLVADNKEHCNNCVQQKARIMRLLT